MAKICVLCKLPEGAITKTIGHTYLVHIPDGEKACTTCIGKRRVRALPIKSPAEVKKLMPAEYNGEKPKPGRTEDASKKP